MWTLAPQSSAVNLLRFGPGLDDLKRPSSGSSTDSWTWGRPTFEILQDKIGRYSLDGSMPRLMAMWKLAACGPFPESTLDVGFRQLKGLCLPSMLVSFFSLFFFFLFFFFRALVPNTLDCQFMCFASTATAAKLLYDGYPSNSLTFNTSLLHSSSCILAPRLFERRWR